MKSNNGIKIISGMYKGKNLAGFDIDGTRPTMNRVKESMFAMIQSYIKDAIVLDLFAGSGSLGIEAISNGAKTCYFVDENIESINIIRFNTKNMISEDIRIMKDDYKSAINHFKNNKIKFDLVFLDPPYNLYLISDCIKLLKEKELLNDGAIVICEYEKENIDLLGFEVIKDRKFGTKKIKVLTNKYVK